MRTALALSCVLLLPAVATAQTFRPHPYLSVGWYAVSREAPFLETFTDRDAPGRSFIHGILIAGGIQLTPQLGLEASMGWHRAQPVPWEFRYLFAPMTDEVTADRDTPIVGYLRLMEPISQRVSLAFLVGGGFNMHSAISRSVADCGTDLRPKNPCVPIEPKVSDRTRTTNPMVGFGIDVPIRLTERMFVVPTGRVAGANRRTYLTGYDHRGPETADGMTVAVGVSMQWQFR